MGKYIAKRLMIAIPVLIGITILDFWLMTRVGNPLEVLQGARISEAALEVKRVQLGLDKPLYMQYFIWLRNLLQGNMGYSLKSYQPVAQLIGQNIGSTLLLMGTSLVVSMLIAIPAGIYSAAKKYSKGDYTIVTLSFLGSSIPGFFLSLLLIYVFTVQLKWLPSSGMYVLGEENNLFSLIKHMIMPVLVLSISLAGTNIRYIRSAMLEILEKDYLRMAKAKGLSRFRIINIHGLRNALLPIVTILGLQIPVLFGGTIIVEQVFSWPGLGLITINAVINRDYPVIMGICLMSAIVVLLANIVTDILYAVVDPTIRYDRRNA